MKNQFQPSMSITVEITNQCVNSCPGCFISNNPIYMTNENLKKILKKIPDIGNSVVVFSGGEPLLHPKIKELLTTANEITGTRPFILTSGAIPFNLSSVAEVISGVIVSIKYPTEIQDEMFKGFRRAHENALSLLSQATDLGLGRQINWVVDDVNKFHYKDMIRLAHFFGAELNMLKYIKYNEANVIREIPLEEFEKAALKARKFGRKYKTTVNVFFPCKWSTGYSCSYGVTRIAITPTGDLKGCIYGIETHGNLLKQSYEEINANVNQYLVKYYKKKKCLVEVKLDKIYKGEAS